MITIIFRTLAVLAVLWGIGEFIISPLRLETTLTEPALITAILCSTVVLGTIVIGFVIKK